MSELVFSGAIMRCQLGTTPSRLIVTSNQVVTMTGVPAATVMDNQPIDNVPTFGSCQRSAPPPLCVPVTSSSPWKLGSTTLVIEGKPALNTLCKLICTQGGEISIVEPGQSGVNAP